MRNTQSGSRQHTCRSRFLFFTLRKPPFFSLPVCEAVPPRHNRTTFAQQTSIHCAATGIPPRRNRITIMPQSPLPCATILPSQNHQTHKTLNDNNLQTHPPLSHSSQNIFRSQIRQPQTTCRKDLRKHNPRKKSGHAKVKRM